MNKWVLILLVFSLAVNLAAVGTLVYFSHRPGPPQPEPGMMMEPRGMRGGGQREPGLRGAELTPEQRRAIGELRRKYQASIDPLAMEVERARGDVMRLIAANPPATDSIRIVLAKINKLQGEMELATVEHLIAMRPYLKKESWQMLTRRLGSRMAGPRLMRPGGQPGAGMPQGPGVPPDPEGGRDDEGRPLPGKPDDGGAPPRMPEGPDDGGAPPEMLI